MTPRPVVLLSGTSSGIGLASAVACASRGWLTVATMRDLDRSGALLAAAAERDVDLDVRALDVTDDAAVEDCVAEVVADHGRLDAVVNNAGAAHLGTIENETIDDVRACFEVNFFGVVRLTRASMPHLRASRGRVLTVSSVGGVVGQPFNEAYCAAKFAVEGFMQSLTPVARTVGVQVGLIEPGAVTSEFVANADLDIPAMLAAAGPYEPALAAYSRRTMAQFESGSTSAQTPAQVAEVVLSCLEEDLMPFRAQTSEWARDFVALSLADRDGSTVASETDRWVAG